MTMFTNNLERKLAWHWCYVTTKHDLKATLTLKLPALEALFNVQFMSDNAMKHMLLTHRSHHIIKNETDAS